MAQTEREPFKKICVRFEIAMYGSGWFTKTCQELRQYISYKLTKQQTENAFIRLKVIYKDQSKTGSVLPLCFIEYTLDNLIDELLIENSVEEEEKLTGEAEVFILPSNFLENTQNIFNGSTENKQ